MNCLSVIGSQASPMACDAFWPGFLLLVIVVELYRPSMAILISSHLVSRLVFIYFINATLDAISFVFMSVIVLETMYDVLCMLLLHGGGISRFANSTLALVLLTGVSWRLIVRPTLVIAAFCPGLLVSTSLYSLLSGAVKLHFVQWNFPAKPPFSLF